MSLVVLSVLLSLAVATVLARTLLGVLLRTLPSSR